MAARMRIRERHRGMFFCGVSMSADNSESRYVSPYDVATICAALGRRDQAFVWLEKAYHERSGWLGVWLNVDPKFDNLRSEPRFSDLLQRVTHKS